VVGIYKITSHLNEVYIGQSTDIERRLHQYKILNCIGQTKIYRSFISHGVESHNFEIIEECSICDLDDRERHYQDLYDVCGDRGLNCSLTKTKDKKGVYLKAFRRNRYCYIPTGHNFSSIRELYENNKDKFISYSSAYNSLNKSDSQIIKIYN